MNDKSLNLDDRPRAVLEWAVVCVAAVVAVWACAFMVWHALSDYLLEYREFATVLNTDFLLQGKNPYALENQPLAVNVYGILYHLVVFPLALVFGCTPAVHRIVSCVFVFATSGCLLWVMYCSGVSWRMSSAAALLLFGELATGLSLAARPDSMGQFLFLAGLAVPYRWGFSRASLVVSVLLTVLGFFTKPYFVLGAPLLAAYLFVFEDKLKGVWYAGLFAVTLVITGAIVHTAFETYFMNTIFIHVNFTRLSWSHLVDHLWLHAATHFGILLVLLAGIIWSAKCYMSGRTPCRDVKNSHGARPQRNMKALCFFAPRWQRAHFRSQVLGGANRQRTTIVGGFGRRGSGRKLFCRKVSSPESLFHENPTSGLRTWKGPLLESNIGLPMFVLVCSMALLVWKMGRHTGNGQLYYHHMVTPFLLWSAFGYLGRLQRKLHWSMLVAVLLNLVVIHQYFLYSDYRPKPFADHTSRWKSLERVLTDRSDVYAAPGLAYILHKNGKILYDTGQNEYFTGAAGLNLGPIVEKYSNQGKLFWREVRDKARDSQLDLIIRLKDTYWPVEDQVLQRNYRLAGKLIMPLLFNGPLELELWERRDSPVNPRE